MAFRHFLTRPGGLRAARLESAARTEGEGVNGVSDWEKDRDQVIVVIRLLHFLHCLVILGQVEARN